MFPGSKGTQRVNSGQVGSVRDANNGEHAMDMKLEVVVIPVQDVDRSVQFYQDLGWRLDANVAPDDAYRVVQLTPPGSPTSIIFGTNVTSQAPGSAQGLQLIVDDIDAARSELAGHGV